MSTYGKDNLFGYGLWLVVVLFSYIWDLYWSLYLRLKTSAVSSNQTKCLNGIAKLSQYQKVTSNGFVKIQKLLSKGKRFLVSR